MHALHLGIATQGAGHRLPFRAVLDGACDIDGADDAGDRREVGRGIQQSLLQLVGMALLDLARKRDQQPLAGAEVFIGDRFADAGALGKVAEGERVGTAFPQDLLGRFDELRTPFGLGKFPHRHLRHRLLSSGLPR
ncbi:hypothetical protein D3C87_1622650 [compost metagenome]